MQCSQDCKLCSCSSFQTFQVALLRAGTAQHKDVPANCLRPDFVICQVCSHTATPHTNNSKPHSSSHSNLPISLLTIMTETSTVSGRMASCNCCRSMRPSFLTGK